jgi:hypothetical protein
MTTPTPAGDPHAAGSGTLLGGAEPLNWEGSYYGSDFQYLTITNSLITPGVEDYNSGNVQHGGRHSGSWYVDSAGKMHITMHDWFDGSTWYSSDDVPHYRDAAGTYTIWLWGYVFTKYSEGTGFY